MPFFTKEDTLVACINIDLMEAVNINHKPDEWRLFIDSSKLSLKVVLFHIVNKLPSFLTEYAVHMKESYSSMKLLLRVVSYHKFQLQILWGSLGHCPLAWHTAWLHRVLLFSFWVGHQRTSFSLHITWLAFQKISWTTEPGVKSVQQSPLVGPQKFYFHLFTLG